MVYGRSIQSEIARLGNSCRNLGERPQQGAARGPRPPPLDSTNPRHENRTKEHHSPKRSRTGVPILSGTPVARTRQTHTDGMSRTSTTDVRSRQGTHRNASAFQDVVPQERS
jgi:hypothetical protein